MRVILSILLVLAFIGPAPVTSARTNEICITRFGAIPDDDRDDLRAIQRAIDASKPGDTVSFPAGVFDSSGTIFLRSNRTYRASEGTVLRFNNLPADTYGIALMQNCAEVTFTGFKLIGGGIRLSDGERYRDIRIIGNSITRPADTPGIFVSIPSDRLIVERNRFHDYDHYGIIAYHLNQASVSRNVFHNITQGAHLLGPREDCRFSFNHGTRLTRMGLEVQRIGDVIARNTLVEGNVFHDWKLPFRDSFGLSIVPDGSINTRIINNYLRADFTGPWNDETKHDGQGQRFGYGIEAGFASGVVEGNIIGGAWANHIVVSHRNTPVRSNKLYGRPVWEKYITGEPGPGGFGSAIQQNNLIEPDMSKMPPPPDMRSILQINGDAEARTR